MTRRWRGAGQARPAEETRSACAQRTCRPPRPHPRVPQGPPTSAGGVDRCAADTPTGAAGGAKGADGCGGECGHGALAGNPALAHRRTTPVPSRARTTWAPMRARGIGHGRADTTLQARARAAHERPSDRGRGGEAADRGGRADRAGARHGTSTCIKEAGPRLVAGSGFRPGVWSGAPLVRPPFARALCCVSAFRVRERARRLALQRLPSFRAPRGIRSLLNALSGTAPVCLSFVPDTPRAWRCGRCLIRPVARGLTIGLAPSSVPRRETPVKDIAAPVRGGGACLPLP